MIVYSQEEKRPTNIGIYPNIDCLYATIPYSIRQHMERVGKYADAFVQYLLTTPMQNQVRQLGEEFLEHVKQMYTLHDVGWLYVPIRILNKPEGLTEEEMLFVKEHPTFTVKAMQALYEKPYSDLGMKYLTNICMFHHERYDGNGYPNGLKKEEIPFEACICALVDAYDAMTSFKPYRKAMPYRQVKENFTKQAGKQFHPELTIEFIKCMDKGKLYERK